MAGICFQFLAHSGAFLQFILINLQFTQQFQYFNGNLFQEWRFPLTELS